MTVLIAAQRLSTVEVADRAVVLVDGRIVEDGTPRRAARDATGSSPRSSATRLACRVGPATGLSRLWRYPEGTRPADRRARASSRRSRQLRPRHRLAARRPGASTAARADELGPADVARRRLRRRERARLGPRHATPGAGLADLGQSIVLAVREHLFGHLTTLSLRYFSEQRAGWIIARLTSDVDALSDVLSQGLATLVSNVLMLVAAIVGPVRARLAARARGARRAAAGPRRHALVPAPLARGVRRRAHEDRGADGADRRVRRRHGDRAGVQPRARVPGRVRRAERGEPARRTRVRSGSRRSSSRRSSSSA